jgi:pimeloyl-ACP methyl ester carboxylesterase
MPHATTADSVRLYFEDTGAGTPIIFVHEFAGDYRAWEPQVRHFSKNFRCITYNARGYPPSDVPPEPTAYSQARARDDVIAVLDHLAIDRAHVVGLSMGGFATLHVGLAYPQRCLSLVVAGCGYGAAPEKRAGFQVEVEAAACLFDGGIGAAAEHYSMGQARVQYQNKDPRGFAEFRRQLAEHSALGSANTLRGVQKMRPSLWELREAMTRLEVPTLIVTGDEDEPCLEPGLLMKRCISSSALLMLPRTGHACNLEEPELFNRALDDFFLAVTAGRWGKRDPRSLAPGILGFEQK